MWTVKCLAPTVVKEISINFGVESEFIALRNLSFGVHQLNYFISKYCDN